MPDDFIENGLTDILKRLTGLNKFFSKHEMKCNSMGIYFSKNNRNIYLKEMLSETKVLFHLPSYHRSSSLYRHFGIWSSMLY